MPKSHIVNGNGTIVTVKVRSAVWTFIRLPLLFLNNGCIPRTKNKGLSVCGRRLRKQVGAWRMAIRNRLRRGGIIKIEMQRFPIATNSVLDVHSGWQILIGVCQAGIVQDAQQDGLLQVFS